MIFNLGQEVLVQVQPVNQSFSSRRDNDGQE